jgi:hypothetical protein
MTTKLDKPLKREIIVGEQPFTVTMDAQGLKLVEKGRRKGVELLWKDIVGGDAQLATAVRATSES